MNIALIIAGGHGERMSSYIPKQFLTINDKPIIVYTMESFQNHDEIDKIMVVCLKGYEDILRSYAKQFNINKLEWIVTGGENGQSSIRNGIFELEKHCSPTDYILIHDSVRPLVAQSIISDNIASCKEYGSAITAIPCTEVILQKQETISNKYVPRETLVRTQTPQTFQLQKLSWAHREALNRGITNATATCSMMIDLGESVHLCKGLEGNMKLTTSEDITIISNLLKINNK